MQSASSGGYVSSNELNDVIAEETSGVISGEYLPWETGSEGHTSDKWRCAIYTTNQIWKDT